MRDRALLIVNADDFGISEGVNRGIAEAHRRGIVTSTTIMANMPAFDHAIQIARGLPGLGVGVHLNITSGYPILSSSQIPRLVGPAGWFHPLSIVLRQLTLGLPDSAQIEAELGAQVERVMAAGITPTHLDSHHHVHVHPALQPIVIRLARRYGVRAIRSTAELDPRGMLAKVGMLLDDDGQATEEGGKMRPPLSIAEGTIRLVPPPEDGKAAVPAEEAKPEGRSPGVETSRQRYTKVVLLSLLGAMLGWRARRAGLAVTDHFKGLLLGLAFNTDDLRGVLARLPAGSTELMCHPGYPDSALRQLTSYADGRASELEALLDPEGKATLAQSGVRLGTFSDLGRR
jgi:predicted glycoside hydrolase/deacetylase ChbG (UPF0249 family)